MIVMFSSVGNKSVALLTNSLSVGVTRMTTDFRRNIKSAFFCSAEFCELPHKISRALARFCVLAHADFILRRSAVCFINGDGIA